MKRPKRAKGRVGDLSRYRAKRDFSKTAEPRGRKERASHNGYLIQKHAARRLHYDFRLELDGVLKSWAVTRGPSLDPADRRLAVHVEDHPLEYGRFEGTIPQGQYGGGTVMLWDTGSWEPEGDAQRMYRAGRLKFQLHGKRLKGEWNLVRMRNRQPRDKHENWLLIKGRDAYARPGDGDRLLARETRSAVSGRDMEEIARGNSVWQSNRKSADPPQQKPKAAPRPAPASRRRTKLEPPKGARAGALPDFVPPQLATRVEQPPSQEGWIHEIKFDGYRAQARIDRGKVKILTRRGLDWCARFPNLAPALLRLPVQRALLDGEIVALDDSGRPDFGRLQANLSEGRRDGFIFMLFDLLHLDGRDLRALPLGDRKQKLRELLAGQTDPLRFSEHFSNGGAELFHKTCELALEGLVSKRLDEPYRPGRGLGWLKSKCRERQEFVIGGYTDPAAGNRGIGALLLGYWSDRGLHYAGRVGTGFSDESGNQLRRRLERIAADESSFADLPRAARRGAHFVDPKLVAEVEFANWTRDRLIRQGAFIGLREDKPAKSIRLEVPISPADSKSASTPASKPASARAGRPTGHRSRKLADHSGPDLVEGIRLTHPDKQLYGADGPSKRELAEYYVRVAPLILPHLRHRPLALVRCPDGQGKPCFYQKHLSAGMPEAIRPMKVKEKSGVESYVSIEDLPGLIGLVQFGVLEIHPWGASPDDVDRADRITIDLDPDPAVEWKRMIETAREVRRRLAALGLRAFLKTTGGKGLHVVAPLSPPVEWQVAKAFTKLLADRLVADDPAGYIATASKSARKGKIFVDYLRNQRGATAVAPYSTRAKPGATVSVPIEWEELTPKMRSDRFTVANLAAYLARRKKDPWREFFKVRQTIEL